MNTFMQMPKQEECIAKLTCLFRGNSSREMNTLMWMPPIFSSQLACTLEEAAIVVSMEYLLYV